jgi:hypothetical protein
MPEQKCRKCRGTGYMICPVCGGKGVAYRSSQGNPERQQLGPCFLCGGMKRVPCDNPKCAAGEKPRL